MPETRVLVMEFIRERGGPEAGAERGRVLESCAVAVSIGGTMAVSETIRVMQYLEERGLL